MVTNLKDSTFSKGIRTKATKLLNAEAFVMVPEKLIDFIKSSLLALQLIVRPPSTLMA